MHTAATIHYNTTLPEIAIAKWIFHNNIIRKLKKIHKLMERKKKNLRIEDFFEKRLDKCMEMWYDIIRKQSRHIMWLTV